MKWMVFVAVAAASACSVETAPMAVTVQQLDADLVRYDRKTVLVRGWIGVCSTEDCNLSSSRELAGNEADEAISIGSTPEFDQAAVGKGPAEVIIQGRVDATCRRPSTAGMVRFCVDRIAEIYPTHFRFTGKT